MGFPWKGSCQSVVPGSVVLFFLPPALEHLVPAVLDALSC